MRVACLLIAAPPKWQLRLVEICNLDLSVLGFAIRFFEC